MTFRFVSVSALGLGLTLLSQATPAQSSMSAPSIQGRGCVVPAVEAGCTILKDVKNGQVYNLFFASGTAPAHYTGISFEGTAHRGMTTCMQGKPVEVSRWSRANLRCPKPKTPPSPE